MKAKPEPCRCDRYAFPHRADGGKCDQSEREERESRQWLDNMTQRERQGWIRAQTEECD